MMNIITTVNINVSARTMVKKTIPATNFPEYCFVDIKYETKIGVQDARQIPILLIAPKENGKKTISRNTIKYISPGGL